MTEPKCELCDAGSVVIDGWHYTRLGEMIFATNKRCAKVYPSREKPADMAVLLVTELMCGRCGQAMSWVPAADHHGKVPSPSDENWPAMCARCELTALVPLTWRTCKVRQ